MLILVGTSRYGVGLVTDSAFYLSTAESLLAGQGYWTFQGHAFLRFAPFYPTLLALTGLAGHDLFAIARWMDVLCFGLLNLVVASWLFARLRSGVIALAVSVSILCSVPLQSVFYSALSEPLFILFTTVSLLDLDAFLRTERDLTLSRAALFAGLAWLTRYAGIALILTGGVILLTRRGAGLSRRMRDASLFAFISMIQSAPWLARNYLQSHQVMGHRLMPEATFAASMYHLADTISSWLVPVRFPSGVKVFTLGVAVLFACYASRHIVNENRRRTRGALPGSAPLAVWFVFPLVYVVLLIATSLTWVATEEPNNRYLAPLYIPLALGLALLLDRDNTPTQRPGWKRAVVYVLFLWLLYPVTYSVRRAWVYATSGPGEFSTRAWRESDLMRYLGQHPLGASGFTNEPYAVYLLTRQALGESPTQRWFRSVESPDYPSQMDLELRAGRSVSLVWFQRSTREDLFSLDELRKRYRLEAVASLDDGVVYVVRPDAR